MPKRRVVNLQLAGFIAAALVALVLARFFPIVDLIAGVQERVTHWGVWGAMCYPFLFAFCNVLLLPGGVLCVGAGFFFGLWWGFTIVFLGNAIGAAISFALSRWVAGHWLERKISQNPALRALEPAVKREGWKIILLSQIHPLFPTSLVNYFYGLTRIPFRTYILWTSIGRAPGLFLYAYLGTLGQHGLNLVLGKTHPRILEYWIWGGALIVTVVFFLLLSRIALRTVEKLQRANESSDGAIAAAGRVVFLNG